jgi:hypothetical protein
VVGAGRTPEEAERNRKLRQAIAIAFDFEEYIQIFEDNRARPNVGPVVPGLFGSDAVKFNPQVYDVVDGKPRRKSIDEARRLLAEAGYPDGRERGTGKPLVINYDTQGVGPGYKARNDWTSKQFAKLNIALEIRNTDYNRFQDKMRKGAAQFFSWGWLADYPDPRTSCFCSMVPTPRSRAMARTPPTTKCRIRCAFREDERPGRHARAAGDHQANVRDRAEGRRLAVRVVRGIYRRLPAVACKRQTVEHHPRLAALPAARSAAPARAGAAMERAAALAAGLVWRRTAGADRARLDGLAAPAARDGLGRPDGLTLRCWPISRAVSPMACWC